MLSGETIQSLKQTNLSTDTEKTRQRTESVWKAATKADKQIIIDLADVARTTVYRVFKTGSISAKLIVPIAQTLNINPFFLTGEADERGEYTEELLREFLTKHNYARLLPEQAPVKQRRSRKKAEEKKLANVVDSSDAPVDQELDAPSPEPETAEPDAPVAASEIDSITQDFIDNMTEDEMILLVRSVLLRAKTGGKYAELATKLKRLLLS